MNGTSLVLAKGSHTCHDEGTCLFEAYNWLTRQQHTDSCPPGVSKVLHIFGMRLNDALPDTKRPSTTAILRYFEHGHLPDDLAAISARVKHVAVSMTHALPDSPELTTGLRKLLEAKDCFVRAALDARETG